MHALAISLNILKKVIMFFLHMKAITANTKSTVYLKFSYANSVTKWE